MNKEDHFEGLKKHFIEELHEAVLECEENLGKKMDYRLLNQKIDQSWKSAKLEGVELQQFNGWITDAIPEHSEQINILKQANAA